MDRAASGVVSNGIPRPIRRDAVMTLWPCVLARTADPEVSQTLAAHGASTIETVGMKSKTRGNNCQSMTKRGSFRRCGGMPGVCPGLRRTPE